MFDFETEVDVDDQDKKRSGKAIIKWKMELECRSWGLKSVLAIVPDQEFRGDLVSDEEEDAEKDEAPNFFLKDVQVNMSDTESWYLCPETLTINDGVFTVDF